MSQLTIIANIFVKAEHLEAVKPEILKLIEPTRSEAGCINYDLHQNNENPAHFVFYENWQSRELWRNHIDSPHIASYRAAVEGKIDNVTISEMSQIA
ncbi:antibiotic biosynthesis monooxygenase [Neiella marina]|uniref:Antibiotic biosynthesis monooxygenase n=1 Tax=Neiella holothuriorum TaxID=2870530 RepID=A0ABS7EDH1_9GAMM|nr:putative quinol monooxygenase [Neiella holothuriorum]MBW8190366.1 antibiotic biosynthesis monooxygenase [Neiella holothuriorum]